MMKKAFLPAMIWLAAITLLSTSSRVPMPEFNLFATDKLGHAAAYGLLVLLSLWAFKRANRPTTFRLGLGVFLFSVAYGVLMEFVQFTFCPGRFYEYDDMLANTIGAALAWGFFYFGQKRFTYA